MDPLVLGLLGSLLFVIAMGGLFFVVYRRHLRALRRAGRKMDPLSPLTPARRQMPFQMPPRWLAVRSGNPGFVREALGLRNEPPPAWSDALSRSRERTLFVSNPVDGWVLVTGAALPDAAQDVDATYRFLTTLSRALGEVYFYGADRVLNFHSWAYLEDGHVRRAYAWAGETLWNEGRMTLEERLLGLRCRDYAEEPEPVPYGELAPEQQNTERVLLLARRWSTDFVAASEILLQQEGVESDGNWPE